MGPPALIHGKIQNMDYPFSFSALPLTLAQSGEAGAPVAGGPAATGTTQQPSGGGPGPTSGGNPAPGSALTFMWPIIAVFVVFMLMSSMAQRKDKRKRAELMSGIKRGDRVQTVGGIIGTVSDLSNDELTLKVDDQSNTRIRFARSAVQQVLESRSGSGSAAAVVENKPKGQTTASV
jgi:preprotein translocase subunit YajC